MADIYTTNRGERSKYFGPDGEWQLTGNGIDLHEPRSRLRPQARDRRPRRSKACSRRRRPQGPKPQVREGRRRLRQGLQPLADEDRRGQDPGRDLQGRAVGQEDQQDGRLPPLLRARHPGQRRRRGRRDRERRAAGRAGLRRSEPRLERTRPTASRLRAARRDSTRKSARTPSRSAPKSTTTGKGMLFGNPHFPWSGTERFYQSQLTIPGKINVSGASLLGAPVVLIGHTQNLAWSHTVSTAQVHASTRRPWSPGDPTSYIVDGQAKKMDSVDVTVAVKQPNGSIETADPDPLLDEARSDRRPRSRATRCSAGANDTAYTMRDPNSDGLRFINHFFDADRSQSVSDMVKTLKRNQGVPWVNTIAADSKGNALYADISVGPERHDRRAWRRSATRRASATSPGPSAKWRSSTARRRPATRSSQPGAVRPRASCRRARCRSRSARTTART